MKKEKSPILVIFCILLLSLFIILPPIFRMTIPKTKVDISKEENTTTPKLILVNCNRIFDSELYQVVSKTKYVDGKINTNTINYQKLAVLPEDYVPPTVQSTITVESELAFFKTLEGIQINTTEMGTTLILDQSLSISNSMNETFMQYYQENPNDQKNFYESLGYQCKILES